MKFREVRKLTLSVGIREYVNVTGPLQRQKGEISSVLAWIWRTRVLFFLASRLGLFANYCGFVG